ncbi:MAG: HIT family protein [Candidatus Bathycorpusculaceae bacterium]
MAEAEAPCVFCAILNRQAPASIVYEDAHVMAFLDIFPQNDGHMLVIPKKHHETIYTLSEEETAHLFNVARKVALAVKKTVEAQGITIAQHNEAAAGQDIFHMHVHVIPRYAGQRLRRLEELAESSRVKLDEIAARIKRNL